MGNYKKIVKDGYILYQNNGGAEIGTAKNQIIEQDGYVFKNLAGEEKLLPYEDWRLSFEERANDLSERLSVHEIIGLTLHSSSQTLPAQRGQMENVGTYDGKFFQENEDAKAWDLTDQQKKMVREYGVRHFLVSKMKDVETAVRWSNAIQQCAEEMPYGIPVNLSSDPRHGAGGEAVEFRNGSSEVSQWPEGLAMAATADPELCERFAGIAAKEYRALGITTALGPQIDLASEPRWFRIRDTFGSDVKLDIAMAQHYCDGLQTTEGSETGWGKDSVIAMAKHWPGGGTGEGGRDAHYPFGKYAVYPGNNFETHLLPFINGAMKLRGKTKSCAAMMPYYTISWNQDVKNHENVGNAYSEYMIKDLLIEKYGFEGVICTDWGITRDKTPHIGMYVKGGKCHGVEALPEEERILKLLMNGVNQFGGLDERAKVDQAYQIGCERFGQIKMDALLHLSAYKLLLNMFRVGLFDNPYLDLEESQKIVGCSRFVEEGFRAQEQSVVLLKNKEGILPLKEKLKVYIPDRKIESHYSFVRLKTKREEKAPVTEEELEPYFRKVQRPEEADAAIVFVSSPAGRNGYEFDMMNPSEQDTGYYPISLQYRPYTASAARQKSLAGGDPRETSANRSYYGKTETTANEFDLDLVLETKKKMKEKPVIVVIRMDKPTILAEMEPAADVILAEFWVQKKAIFQILTGKCKPCGKLPVILPKDMETVEQHCEDVENDIEPYVDTEGNIYTTGYGMEE